MKITRLVAVSLGTCLIYAIASTANAALYSRAGGTMVYDSDLDVTWLADANYAGTLGLGISGSGMMYRDDALAWVDSLVLGGLDAWRLPETLNPDPACSIQGAYTTGYQCSGSEMGHLYYLELLAISPSVNPDKTWGPFYNFPIPNNAEYWSSTDGPGNEEWGFSFTGGTLELINTGGNPELFALYVFPVIDGDVAAVPIPAAIYLLGSGLIGLVSVTRKRAA